jgi:hypothetical protein
VITIGLKTVAYLLTGSVGLLSDALESLINLVGAVMLMAMLAVAARPADEEHPYGHDSGIFCQRRGRCLDCDRRYQHCPGGLGSPAEPQPVEQAALG